VSAAVSLLSANPHSEFRRAAVRIFWLIATGTAAVLLAPDIASDAGRASPWANTPASLRVLSIMILAEVLVVWLIVGTVCGLLMERQPWYRNLYLLVVLILPFLLFPRIH